MLAYIISLILFWLCSVLCLVEQYIGVGNGEGWAMMAFVTFVGMLFNLDNLGD